MTAAADRDHPPRRPATYTDIRRATGLSLSTISKHFNGRSVTAASREAIERAAAELEFRPNAFASRLRSRRSGTIGVLLPALDNEFHLTVIAGVESALREHSMSVIVSSSPDAGVGAVDLLLSRMVDGIIAVPSPHDVPALRRAAAVMPVVQIDWSAGSLDTDGVFLDNPAAGRMAARHLLDHGHRELAVVGGDRAVSTMAERADGFRQAVADAGSVLDQDAVTAAPLTVRGGSESMSRLLMRSRRPTAVFCANYELTLGAVIAINESGLRLGRDISLLGFDGTDLALATVPRLTVIRQPTHDIARLAADRIRARLAAETPVDTERTLVAPRLAAGASVIRLEDQDPC